ncbi:MAG: CoA transferase [Chloroflexi bacterium]|nr:CoA transferase [Chloroflexota bacterium]
MSESGMVGLLTSQHFSRERAHDLVLVCEHNPVGLEVQYRIRVRVLTHWTLGRQVEEVVQDLQAAGVPAGPVLDSAQVLADPHMIERGFVQSPDHPEVGPRPMGAFPWTLDGSQPGVARGAPLFGEHNQRVIQELLQVPDEEFARLIENGVIR